MKHNYDFGFLRSCRAGMLVCGALGALLSSVQGQTAVTGVTYGTTVDSSNSTADNIRYLNTYTPVATISTAAGSYKFDGPLADSVYIRRNTSSGNPNNSSVFYQYQSDSNGVTSVYSKGDTTPTLSEVMLSNDLTQGLRNPFANDGGTESLTSNIERIDFRYNGGYTVQAGDSLVFFDLENVGNFGDGFRIAAVTSWGTYNGTSAPTAYANSGLLIDPDSYGSPVATPLGGNASYVRSTTTNGDNISSNQSVTFLDSNTGSANSSDLYLVGIMITFADLGIAPGTVIQGFSLMAGDVAATTSGSLLNWNNSSVYKTDTDATTWGNVDFMGFGGQISRPVPEPATYGVIFMSLCTGGFLLRRRHFARR
ncbi:PEP-CTERM sorting domain-containing protein [Rariglobus hedericola]|nr:PEP-CTERM sorting domain-containing protein [Rariglobus hedericola]